MTCVCEHSLDTFPKQDETFGRGDQNPENALSWQTRSWQPVLVCACLTSFDPLVAINTQEISRSINAQEISSGGPEPQPCDCCASQLIPWGRRKLPAANLEEISRRQTSVYLFAFFFGCSSSTSWASSSSGAASSSSCFFFKGFSPEISASLSL